MDKKPQNFQEKKKSTELVYKKPHLLYHKTFI